MDHQRQVTVHIGRPFGTENEPAIIAGVPVDECYSINFMEAGHDTGAVCQSNCLCQLMAATEKWLTGGTLQEVGRVLGHRHTGRNEGT